MRGLSLANKLPSFVSEGSGFSRCLEVESWHMELRSSFFSSFTTHSRDFTRG